MFGLDERTVAEYLAGVLAVAAFAFSVSFGLTVNHFVGLWPGVAVFTFLIAIYAAFILFALGTMNDADRRRGRP
jgi:hypothetical protein